MRAYAQGEMDTNHTPYTKGLHKSNTHHVDGIVQHHWNKNTEPNVRLYEALDHIKIEDITQESKVNHMLVYTNHGAC